MGERYAVIDVVGMAYSLRGLPRTLIIAIVPH